jgi:hypothetical protein
VARNLFQHQHILAHQGDAIHGRSVTNSEFSLDAISLASIDHVVQKDAHIHSFITCLPSIEIIDGEGDQHPDPAERELPVQKTEAGLPCFVQIGILQ